MWMKHSYYVSTVKAKKMLHIKIVITHVRYFPLKASSGSC